MYPKPLNLLTLKTKAIESFETSESTQPKAKCRVPKHLNPKKHDCGNFESLDAELPFPWGRKEIPKYKTNSATGMYGQNVLRYAGLTLRRAVVNHVMDSLYDGLLWTR
jgi:hypothetical protein